MNRIILHLDMDYFFAQVEERRNPYLRTRPVIVGADPRGGHGRGVVSTANYIARRFGVRSGMPISTAYKRCSHAEFISVHMGDYGEVSQCIFSILRELAPSAPFEQVSIDEAYIDVSYTGNYLAAEVLARYMKAEILKREQLTASVGIGPSKMIAKIAAGMEKPNGCTIVLPDAVSSFLLPMKASVLPGVGVKTTERLERIGVRTVRDVLNTSEEMLSGACGRSAEHLLELAQGIDDRSVVQAHVVKSIGRETTFSEDTRDKSIVTQTFIKLAREVWNEVRVNEFRFRTVTIVYRYANFETHTSSRTLDAPTDSFVTLKSVGMQLLLPAFLGTRKAMRLVGIRASQFTPSRLPTALESSTIESYAPLEVVHPTSKRC